MRSIGAKNGIEGRKEGMRANSMRSMDEEMEDNFCDLFVKLEMCTFAHSLDADYDAKSNFF
jgi:hypothetical protein